MNSNNELFIKMAVGAWEMYLTRTTKLIDELTDEQLMRDTAPGRNSGAYIVGHLVAVSDHMQTMMEWGPRRYPQLESIYIRTPDKSITDTPSVSDLREYWRTVHAEVTGHISDMRPEDWFKRHTAVKEEDFVKEPHRNKLNLLMNRTSHMAYHQGQLVYLSKKRTD